MIITVKMNKTFKHQGSRIFSSRSDTSWKLKQIIQGFSKSWKF